MPPVACKFSAVQHERPVAVIAVGYEFSLARQQRKSDYWVIPVLSDYVLKAEVGGFEIGVESLDGRELGVVAAQQHLYAEIEYVGEHLVGDHGRLVQHYEFYRLVDALPAAEGELFNGDGLAVDLDILFRYLRLIYQPVDGAGRYSLFYQYGSRLAGGGHECRADVRNQTEGIDDGMFQKSGFARAGVSRKHEDLPRFRFIPFKYSVVGVLLFGIQ